MEFALTNTVLASAAIVRIARANAAITPAGLQAELERGDIDGWMNVVRRYSLSFHEWSGAMERAIATLEAAAA